MTDDRTAQLVPMRAPRKERSTRFETVPLGLALGGGAARGFAHIPMVEVFDELGIRPAIIAGTSFGAIVGAAYAAGFEGREMREYATGLFARRTDVVKRIIDRWPGAIREIWNPLATAAINAETIVDILMPDGLPETIEALDIPFVAIATDFHNQEQVVIDRGLLIPAIAASCALPALMKPVEIDGRLLIDGGFVNPTPYDVIMDRTPFTVAVDVTGLPVSPEKGTPSSLEMIVGSTLIMLRTILREKLQNRRPDVLIEPAVGPYRAMQFFKCAEILDAAEPSKDELKRALETRLAEVA